ncbi:MAG TPA: TPM domain-containing protein [Mycobacteriales bacterium]|nr:TPM domain-containing protein [Mycobacteriales bacterium]
MGAGDRLRKADRARLARAVERVEAETGLQVCVYLGPGDGESRQHAEQLFQAAGAHTRPAVMLYVAPAVRRVECVVAQQISDRVSDAVAQEVIEAMVPLLAVGDLVGGLEVGLQRIAAAAGPARGDEPGESLPDILG